MKNLFLSIFIIVLFSGCNEFMQNKQISTNTAENEIDVYQNLDTQNDDKPDFSWFSTVEESKMNLTEEGKISLNILGLWKGNLEMDNPEKSFENNQFVVDNTIQIVEGNAVLNSNLVAVDFQNNASKFYPNFKD